MTNLFFLYGPPGVGKSTLGRALAESLELPFEDLDERIVQEAGRAIPDIFAQEGEAGFRERESRVLRDLLSRYHGTRGAVVALGGGALLRRENRARVEATGVVVCLMARLETLLQRLRQAPEARPLVPRASAEALERLLRARAAHYASFARRVWVDDRPLPDVLWEVHIALGAFRLKAMAPPYDVRVRAGLLRSLDAPLQAWGKEVTAWALVSDERVMALHGDPVRRAIVSLGQPLATYVLPPGEGTKSLPWLQHLWAGFLQAGLDRQSAVVALGGGVIGDLAGFAAATFMRGIPWFNLPTTLLAMVDASIGGKTSIDLEAAKNAVGAFHPPRAVLMDPDTLHTLPEEQWRYGMAEVIKHALLGDPVLWERLQGGWGAVYHDTEALVRRALAVKVRVVEDDPWERTGQRAQLNAGHTVGHAIETALGYAFPHGAAVAVGLVVEAALAEALGLAPRDWHREVASMVARFHLPTRIPPGVRWTDFVQALAYDKKRYRGRVRFALPVAVGRVVTNVDVPLDTLQRVVSALQEEVNP